MDLTGDLIADLTGDLAGELILISFLTTYKKVPIYICILDSTDLISKLFRNNILLYWFLSSQVISYKHVSSSF